MEKDTEITPVVFRKFSEGDVIALFPTLPGNHNFWTCDSYMIIGQHGSADLGIIQTTKPATEEEYKDTKKELETEFGYNLKVYKRIQPWMDTKRYEWLKRLLG